MADPVHYCGACGQPWSNIHECYRVTPPRTAMDNVQIIARAFPDAPEMERLRADNAALRERVAALEAAAVRMLEAIDAMDGWVCQEEDLLVLDGPAEAYHAATAALRAAAKKEQP